MGQSVHFIKDLGSGHEGGGHIQDPPRVVDTLAKQQQMNKQLKLINDFYYYRPGKGALSSNTCYFCVCA